MEVSYGVVQGEQGLHPQNLRTDSTGMVHSVSLYEIMVDYSDSTQGHLPVEYVRSCNVGRVDHARSTWTDEPATCTRGSVVDLQRLRRCTRSRRERREEHLGRRAGGVSLWRR